MYRRSTVSHTAHRDIVLGLMDENGPEVLFYSRGWDARGSQWHFLEDFVSDFYIRRYGLHRCCGAMGTSYTCCAKLCSLGPRNLPVDLSAAPFFGPPTLPTFPSLPSPSSLAEQHMRTLVRSVALHQADLHIRMFSRLLEGSLSSNDQAFFLVGQD